MRRNFVFLSCVLAIGIGLSSPSSAQTNADIEAFRQAHAAAADVRYDSPESHQVGIVLEMLIKHAYESMPKSGDGNAKSLEKAFAAYDKVVEDPDKSATQTGWLEASYARKGNTLAILVNYGPFARLAVFESGKRLPVRGEATYLSPYAGAPDFMSDGSLVLDLWRVQDMGMRIGLRVVTLDRTSGWHVVTSFEKPRTLDWGGVVVKGDRVTVSSIDLPKSFHTYAGDTMFERKETFKVSKGKLTSVNCKLDKPELRWLDQWMANAQQTKKPTAQQAALKKLFPEPAALDSWSVKRGKNGLATYHFETSESFDITVQSKNGKRSVVKIVKR